MGPQPNGYGNVNDIAEYLGIDRASMGPQPNGYGNEKQESIAVQEQGFNGATT